MKHFTKGLRLEGAPMKHFGATRARTAARNMHDGAAGARTPRWNMHVARRSSPPGRRFVLAIGQRRRSRIGRFWK